MIQASHLTAVQSGDDHSHSAEHAIASAQKQVWAHTLLNTIQASPTPFAADPTDHDLRLADGSPRRSRLRTGAAAGGPRSISSGQQAPTSADSVASNASAIAVEALQTRRAMSSCWRLDTDACREARTPCPACLVDAGATVGLQWVADLRQQCFTSPPAAEPQCRGIAMRYRRHESASGAQRTEVIS